MTPSARRNPHLAESDAGICFGIYHDKKEAAMTWLLGILESEKKRCTGCSACRDICPVDAITMQTDQEGFAYPVVQAEKCIHCGRCEKSVLSDNPDMSIRRVRSVMP